MLVTTVVGGDTVEVSLEREIERECCIAVLLSQSSSVSWLVLVVAGLCSWWLCGDGEDGDGVGAVRRGRGRCGVAGRVMSGGSELMMRWWLVGGDGMGERTRVIRFYGGCQGERQWRSV
ncbi:hypothetical protein ACFE04_001522 [Oxalis oulophora]